MIMRGRLGLLGEGTREKTGEKASPSPLRPLFQLVPGLFSRCFRPVSKQFALGAQSPIKSPERGRVGLFRQI